MTHTVIHTDGDDGLWPPPLLLPREFRFWSSRLCHPVARSLAASLRCGCYCYLPLSLFLSSRVLFTLSLSLYDCARAADEEQLKIGLLYIIARTSSYSLAHLCLPFQVYFVSLWWLSCSDQLTSLLGRRRVL